MGEAWVCVKGEIAPRRAQRAQRGERLWGMSGAGFWGLGDFREWEGVALTQRGVSYGRSPSPQPSPVEGEGGGALNLALSRRVSAEGELWVQDLGISRIGRGSWGVPVGYWILAACVRMVGGTPPQVPVSVYGAGSSSGTPQDDSCVGRLAHGDARGCCWRGYGGGATASARWTLRHVQGSFRAQRRGVTLTPTLSRRGRGGKTPHPRSPYRGTGQALRVARDDILSGRALRHVQGSFRARRRGVTLTPALSRRGRGGKTPRPRSPYRGTGQALRVARDDILSGRALRHVQGSLRAQRRGVTLTPALSRRGRGVRQGEGVRRSGLAEIDICYGGPSNSGGMSWPRK